MLTVAQLKGSINFDGNLVRIKNEEQKTDFRFSFDLLARAIDANATSRPNVV